jgi:cytochrome c-type biogenesis protein
MNISQISFGVAFIAGLASFLSPCVLSLVPIYLAQLVGHSVYQSTDGQQGHWARLDTFLHALMFVLGFTLAFVALDATASTLGSFLRSYQILLRQVGSRKENWARWTRTGACPGDGWSLALAEHHQTNQIYP